MYLFYLFNEAAEWEFWDSVPWDQLSFNLLKSICLDIDGYIGDKAVYSKDGKLISDVTHPVIDYARFVHDMILYKQYITSRLAIYFVNMPR